MTAAESLREKLDKAVEKSRGVLISWELSSALLAELEAAEKEVINQQRECHTIRRAYLHEKCVKEAAEERVRELTQQPTKCPKGHPVPYQGCKYCGMLGDFADANRVELIEIIFKWHDAFYREENRANAERSRLSVMETALRKLLCTFRVDWSEMTAEEKKWATEYANDDAKTEAMIREALSDQGGNNGRV